MVNPEQVKNRRMQIMHVHRVNNRMHAEFIGLPMGKTTLDSTSGQIYVIERSRDLLAWQQLWQENVTVSDGMSAFTDEEAPLDGNVVFDRVRKGG